MNAKRICSVFLAIILAVGLLGFAPIPSARADNTPPPIDLDFLQYCQDHPDEVFPIIVQKMHDNSQWADWPDPDTQVYNGNGRVKNALNFINSFSAELSGAEVVRLAGNPKTRWISYDAPMFNTATAVDAAFTTWATSAGTVTSSTFANSAKMVDSSLGGNGTYGYGAVAKGAFGGFVGQATPGNAILKVEVVVKAYTAAALAAAQDPIITPSVNGVKGSSKVLNHNLLANYIGAANAGLAYLDITTTRQWHWADFEGDLQIMVDQSKFAKTSTIYYDAIGLRVSSGPGTDTSLDSLSSTLPADSTVDGSKQLNVYNSVIGAAQLWNTTNKIQGKGVTVAVVDSGLYKTKDLSGRVKVNVNFNPSYHDAADRYGHGTFVAGIIAGSGTQSSGKYIGVAPKASLLNVRIADDQGMVYESDVIDSLQWVYNNKDKYGIRIVNMSLNSTVAQDYDASPLDAAVEILWFNGIVVVVSAGNTGSGAIYPPANDPFVITVGATDDRATASSADDTIATFSVYGTTESGFAKPELVAPGKLIIGLLPENDKLSMGSAHPSNRVDTTYYRMSGTSVSAPMVSGAVALLLQDEPNLTPDQVKYRLMTTANKSWPGYDPAAAGAGYVNAYAAVMGASTASANTGILPSQMLTTGTDPITFGSVGWNSVGWNSVGWNSVGWNSVGWNSVGWNSDYWGQ